ncbi:MAG: prolipoprotein diacylglyceryl transferase [Chlamydiia bacterium]
MMLAIFFDPPRIAFTIPFIEYPIAWYGVLFALGFWLALKMFQILCDRYPFSSLTGEQIGSGITNYMIFGIVFGARLFHLLFYEPIEWVFRDPFMLFRFWEGGLASHGGIICAFLAGLVFARKWNLSAVSLSDLAFPSAMILGASIRVGNFMNQEILGLPTTLPWGVIFQKPSSMLSFGVFPRHPVQIYEALFYLVLAALGVVLLERGKRNGFVSGVLCLSFACGRFFLEFFKEEQSLYTIGFPLTMGQILSVPFIVVGLAALFFYRPCKAD